MLHRHGLASDRFALLAGLASVIDPRYRGYGLPIVALSGVPPAGAMRAPSQPSRSRDVARSDHVTDVMPFSPSPRAWEAFSNDPEVMLSTCLKYRHYVVHAIPHDSEMGTPADYWEVQTHFGKGKPFDPAYGQRHRQGATPVAPIVPSPVPTGRRSLGRAWRERSRRPRSTLRRR